ncbi:diacylglycerol/lipid kinase family protein [Pseudoroseomonas wenyumeiae]
MRQIDIGLVNGEVFLCQSVIGLPNRVGLHRERVRGRDGLAARWRVALGFLRALWRHPPMRLGLRPDGQPMRRVWTGAVSVVNNAYDEAPGRFFHRPRLDAGVLTWLVARDFDLWWAAKLIASMALGRWRGGRADCRRGRQPGHLQPPQPPAGHERRRGDAAANSLRYSIRPRALRVLAPPLAEAPPQRAAEGAACG